MYCFLFVLHKAQDYSGGVSDVFLRCVVPLSIRCQWKSRRTWEVASFISLFWQERYHMKADKCNDIPFKCSFITLLGTNISAPKRTFEDDFLIPMVGYVSSLEGSLDDIGLRNKSAICLTSRIHLREPPFTISCARLSFDLHGHTSRVSKHVTTTPPACYMSHQDTWM